MKKLALTIAIVLGLGVSSFAEGDNNHQGGVFQRGAEPREYANGLRYNEPMLPNHGLVGNADAPLGSGIAMLLTLGGAYLVAKKRNEE